MAYVRTVKTSSGATAVQIVWSSRRGSRSIEHLGSAHDEAELAALKAAAAAAVGRRAGRAGPRAWPRRSDSEPLPITSSQMTPSVGRAVPRPIEVLGFESGHRGRRGVSRSGVGADHRADQQGRRAAGARARPGSRRPSYRHAQAPPAGVSPNPAAGKRFRRHAPRMPGWGRLSLVLFDVSTLYFETDAGDGFREPGFSKERRLEPQITLGSAHRRRRVPADGRRRSRATRPRPPPCCRSSTRSRPPTSSPMSPWSPMPGMISEANQVALQAAGLSFILGARIPYLPDVVREWRDKHPDEAVPDGLVLTQPWPATSSGEGPRDPRSGHPLPVPPRPGPAHAARHRRAGRQSRTCRRRARPGQTQPLHPAVRRDQERQPRAGGQDPGPGRVEGLHHQPRRPARGVRHRRLPPAVAHREGLPDVQARPAGPPDLPPHPRIHRGAPEHRVRRDGRQPLHRDTKPAGASRNSSAPPAATAPSRSKPADKPSPPPTRYPTTSRDALAKIRGRRCALI